MEYLFGGFVLACLAFWNALRVFNKFDTGGKIAGAAQEGLAAWVLRKLK